MIVSKGLASGWFTHVAFSGDCQVVGVRSDKLRVARLASPADGGYDDVLFCMRSARWRRRLWCWWQIVLNARRLEGESE